MALLDQFGGYQLELRGEIEIKVWLKQYFLFIGILIQKHQVLYVEDLVEF